MRSDVLYPKPSAALPPEILDKILEHVPTNREGRPTLVACALVATWWTGPSRRRLFSSVEIGGGNYQQWMDGVVHSGFKAHLLEYVHSLSHCRSGFRVEYRMRDLAQDSGKYLSALRNLRSLTLSNIRVQHINEEEFRVCFSAFRETLTYLSLWNSITSFSAFVTLVDYFPNIRTLQLCWLAPEPDEGPVPPLSRPLRGKVHIHHFRSHSTEFLNRFAKLDMEYEELVITFSPLAETVFMEGALQISANTVEFLRLNAEPKARVAVTMRNFRQLRELELEVTWPDRLHRAILSSIASTKLQKIIFRAVGMKDWNIFIQKMMAWALVDEQLCELVDRLHAVGYRHTLEVELRFMEIGGDPEKHDFTIFLPRFREKGLVTITDNGTTRLTGALHRRCHATRWPQHYTAATVATW